MTQRQQTPNVLDELTKIPTARKVEVIPYLQIRTNGGTQMRAKLDRDTVTEYADEMRRGADFPPIELIYDGADYWLHDGFHRHAAHREAFGTSTPIRAYVTAGVRRDAVLMAAGANADHGLRRTQADKARAVDALLNDDEWGAWADREIARRCNVSHVFVAKRRKALVKAGDVEPVAERKFVGKHGESTMKAQKVTGNITSDDDDADDDAGGDDSSQSAQDAQNATSDENIPDEPQTAQDGPESQPQQGIAQLPAGDLPADLVNLGWGLTPMIGGGLYALRKSAGRATRSTSIVRDEEEATALDQTIDLIRVIEAEPEAELVILDGDFEFSTVLVEMKRVTAAALYAWLANHEDGLPGLPADDIAAIRAGCREAMGGDYA